MIYLLVFLLCLLSDRVNNTIRPILICIIGIILCFGYTTGTDWPNYEIYYNGTGTSHFEEREKGFVIINDLFRLIIPDFWIFNAICKIFYLYALCYLIKYFTSKVWTAVAFSMIFTTMFMVVNCPMRYMLSSAIFFIAVRKYLEKKYFKSIILGGISLSFHITIIIPILIFCTYFLDKYLFKINRLLLIIISVICIIISTMSGIYQLIFNHVLDYLGLGVFADSTYSIFNTSGLFTVGTLRNLLLLLILIYYKRLFSTNNKGIFIFYFAVTSFWIGILLTPIPTAFRLIIFNSQMVAIAFAILIWSKNTSFGIQLSLLRPCIYVIFGVLLIKMAYGSQAYYPYTNSIPYILSSHKPYNERINYNQKIYQKEIGPIDMRDDSNGEKI